MNKLIRAHFFRLWRDWFFRVSVLGMGLLGAFTVCTDRSYAVTYETSIPLESGFFVFIPLVALFIACFTPLFIGTEYHDGTLRNLIMVGHERWKIALSHLVVGIGAAFLVMAAYIVIYLLVGIPLLGFFTCSIGMLLQKLLVAMALFVAVTAAVTTVAHLVSSRTHAAITCLLLAITLLFIGVYIYSRLQEPEFFEPYTYVLNGKEFSQGRQPNLHYPSGTLRAILEFLHDFLPAGQMIQLLDASVLPVGRFILYDTLWLIGATGVGLLLFRRKNLK